MNETLGIGIPTYKRPDQLERCLLSVIETARPFEAPVYVLDDAGDETNVATVSALQKKYPLIHHIRNDRNLGIDRNILKSVDACPCRYVWILGEDDRLIPEAVSVMIPALESRPDFVFANYSTVNESVTTVLHEKAIPITADEEREAGDFLKEYGWAAGFIGGCVVNKARWSSVPQEPYIGTYFAHVGTIFQSIHGGRVKMIARPLVLNRCGSAETFTWQAMTFEVLGGWARMTDRLRPVYGDAICDGSRAAFEKAHGLNTLNFLLYARSGGAYDIRQYRKHIQPRKAGAFYKAAAWGIAHAHRGLLQTAHRVLNKLRHQRGRRLRGY